MHLCWHRIHCGAQHINGNVFNSDLWSRKAGTIWYCFLCGDSSCRICGVCKDWQAILHGSVHSHLLNVWSRCLSQYVIYSKTLEVPNAAGGKPCTNTVRSVIMRSIPSKYATPHPNCLNKPTSGVLELLHCYRLNIALRGKSKSQGIGR